MYYRNNQTTHSKQSWYDPSTGESYKSKPPKKCLYFASQFEFAVYLQLKKEIADYQLPFEVICQHPLLVKPATFIFPETRYKIDFCIRDMFSGEEVLYVEAKGGWLLENYIFKNEFMLKLQMMEVFNNEAFSRLAVACSKSLYEDSSFNGKSWAVCHETQDILARFKDYGTV